MTFTHVYDPGYLEPVYDGFGDRLHFGTFVGTVPPFTITFKPYLTPREEIPPVFRSARSLPTATGKPHTCS